MRLFWAGAFIGAVAMFLTMILVFAQAVEEKDKELKYLRRRLSELARAINNEY